MQYEGKVFKTVNFGDLLITKYVNSQEVYVKFVETGYETKTRLKEIKSGKVKDRLCPTVCGVGVIGDEIGKVGGKALKEYRLWKKMLERCYSEKLHKKNPCYQGCQTSENFKYFPYFKDWCNKQIGFGNEGWHLDKDILVKGNRVYSEDTCVFVPDVINKLLVRRDSKRGENPLGVHYCKERGKFIAILSISAKLRWLGGYDTPEEAFYAYKEAKETYLKEIAEKWKDKIDHRVYEALMGYQVEITD